MSEAEILDRSDEPNNAYDDEMSSADVADDNELTSSTPLDDSTCVPDFPVESDINVGRIQRQLFAEKKRVDRNEGNVVISMITIGLLLCELQDHAEGQWSAVVHELGYHPRAASRLQRLGTAWGAQIGTAGSDFLRTLPPDPQKLEWLCRLSQVQLEELQQELGDLKKVNRKEIVVAVKRICGIQEVSRRTESDFAKKFACRLVRMAHDGMAWSRLKPDDEQRRQFHELLMHSTARLCEILNSHSPTEDNR